MNCETISGHLVRDGVAVTPWEAIAFDEINEAAEAHRPCPLNLDIEMELGCSSGSVASTVVARLERKGLIKVIRYQRFREVQIIATGKWTARSASMHVVRPHVPRGAGASRSALPSSRKHYKRGRL